MNRKKDRPDIIYTRGGDLGLTSLSTGERVSKSDFRVDICGEVDELNSFLGLAASFNKDDRLDALLRQAQNELLGLAGKLQTPSLVTLHASHISRIEQSIDELNSELEPIDYFILPGGTPASSACHVARTVCRRIERKLVAQEGKEPVPPPVLQYFNRLSDLLFVLARAMNQAENVPDVRWEKPDFL